jgi:iron complex outermembrane receptor protein
MDAEARMRVLLRVVALAVMAAAVVPARTLAEPADRNAVKLAKQYVDAGLAAQNARDYDTAITLYTKAYELVPHPLLLFNLAQAHRLAGRDDQALPLYEKYLAEEPGGAQAPIAQELVAELRARASENRRAGERAIDAVDDRDAATGVVIVVARRRAGGPL